MFEIILIKDIMKFRIIWESLKIY